MVVSSTVSWSSPAATTSGGTRRSARNAGNRQTMVDVRFARMALLLPVSLLCHPIGALDQLAVGEGVISGNCSSSLSSGMAFIDDFI
jgi:hypothetical protein